MPDKAQGGNKVEVGSHWAVVIGPTPAENHASFGMCDRGALLVLAGATNTLSWLLCAGPLGPLDYSKLLNGRTIVEIHFK